MSKTKALSTRAKPRSTPKSKPKSALTTAPPTFPKPLHTHPPVLPPSRVHTPAYHYPLLLHDASTSKELLAWFEGIEEARSMPWRKRWLDPEEFEARREEKEFGEVLGKRAYEVWVSEVMLQQTRVSTVIPYFNTWISKWPTVQALASASHDEVLAVWKGLGYYSRATRLHEGSQAVVSAAKSESSACVIPSGVEELQKIPGIGRYTAGAVSSIAFGEAEPVLDGNVARVLSRQLGLYVDAKDKKSGDVLWEVADQLVKHVSGYPEKGRSKIPGQWNQALMELGSTICTPRPKCADCPIRKTCRAYTEGEMLSLSARAKKAPSATTIPDIEDACTLCQQLDTEDLATAPENASDSEHEDAAEKQKSAKRRKIEKPQNTISNYFTSSSSSTKAKPTAPAEKTEEEGEATSSQKRKTASTTPAQTKAISTYCSLFPKKMPKKAVPEEHVVVCVVEAQRPEGQSRFLIEQRPAKGLLASLWQFPQSTLPSTQSTPASRKAAARAFTASLGLPLRLNSLDDAAHVVELGTLVHVFTHLKLTMHVQHFRVDVGDGDVEEVVGAEGGPRRKWVGREGMEGETLSTGMRRCWGLVGRG